MFAFLKRKPKVVAYIPEPIHFVGKSPADNEFIQFGGDENFVIFINCYLRELHQQLMNAMSTSIANLPSCCFLVVDNEKEDVLVGLLGPSLDKSQRENIFLLSRHIMNDFIATYPLFIPSLYNEFYINSHDSINKKATGKSLQAFQQSVSELSLTSMFENKQQALNASVDRLYVVRIISYLEGLKKQGMNLTAGQLLGIWQNWRAQVCQPAFKESLLPLKIELPSDDNLNYYVTFVCQIIEPLFNELGYYRVIWWKDVQSQQAWCFITDQRIDPTADLSFFNIDANKSALCLSHDESVAAVDAQGIDSLLDALQLIVK